MLSHISLIRFLALPRPTLFASYRINTMSTTTTSKPSDEASPPYLNIIHNFDQYRSSPAAGRFKIYTRTGTSSLYTGERRYKDDLIFEALGSVDELASTLGLAREFCMDAKENSVSEKIHQIQCLLQDLNSNIATPRSSANELRVKRTVFDENGVHAKQLESWIDEMDDKLEPLKNFILPGGGKAASTLHVARTICRRSERRVVPLVRENIADESCGIYLNRLSDYLFTAARYMCKHEEKEEVIYKKPSSSSIERAPDNPVFSF